MDNVLKIFSRGKLTKSGSKMEKPHYKICPRTSRSTTEHLLARQFFVMVLMETCIAQVCLFTSNEQKEIVLLEKNYGTASCRKLNNYPFCLTNTC